MNDRKKEISSELLELVLVGSDDELNNELLQLLIGKTISLRDKLKEESGYVLTVADTQAALGALETHLNNEKFPSGLTDPQKQLAQVLIDTVILFNFR